LGGFAAIFLRGPTGPAFLLWLLPHGIPELLAIVLCSGAGIALGMAVATPPREGRQHALRRAGRDAVALLPAIVVLFTLAAIIESYVRESLMPDAFRACVMLAVSSLILAYGYYAYRTLRNQGADAFYKLPDSKSR
jgi:uncharacterized membrane protein SpoIIM required for sporulation